MRIHIKGGGWYGCHLARVLMAEHEVVLTEVAPRLFAGASGANPARLHVGAHYPRSYRTRAACREHAPRFMEAYGHLTRHVPQNLYAIAERESLMDFGTYLAVLRSEISVLEVSTFERGLRHVEGAIQISERHVVIDGARAYFTAELRDVAHYGVNREERVPADLVIDCTFCAEAHGVVDIDRFEPCITALLEGPTDTAITIMDGPFPSLYPWNEERELVSLTSAKFTPICRCATWQQARDVLDEFTDRDATRRVASMLEQMGNYYPHVRDYKCVEVLRGVRAMQSSAADARLVQVAVVEPNKVEVTAMADEKKEFVALGVPELAIRAGKIDAVFEAERQVRAHLAQMEGRA